MQKDLKTKFRHRAIIHALHNMIVRPLKAGATPIRLLFPEFFDSTSTLHPDEKEIPITMLANVCLLVRRFYHSLTFTKPSGRYTTLYMSTRHPLQWLYSNSQTTYSSLSTSISLRTWKDSRRERLLTCIRSSMSSIALWWHCEHSSIVISFFILIILILSQDGQVEDGREWAQLAG